MSMSYGTADNGVTLRHRGKAGHWAVTTAILLASAGGYAGLAPAQARTQSPADQERSAPADGVQDIVVTAQKRETSLQATPISIAVLGAEALRDRGIRTISDLMSGAVPSVRVAALAGRPSALTIAMRGMVPTDVAQISRDATVGVYIDGVYLGRAQGLGTELVDIERIEILRGPQGTLFGRNAVGGALSIVTRKPTGELGLDLTAGLRNWDGQNIVGHLNLPKVAGISIKLDGSYSKRDGWIGNPLPGNWDWSAYRRYGFRAAALWQPADNITVEYAYDNSTDKSSSAYPSIEFLYPGAPPLAPIFGVDGGRARSARAGFLMEPNVGKVQGHSLHAEWKIASGLTARSITAYRKLDQTQYDNTAGSGYAFRPNGPEGRVSSGAMHQDQFSQELQLVGSLPGLDYVLGAFYFEEDANDLAYTSITSQFNADGTALIVLPTPTGGAYPDRASEAHGISRALYGQATWTPPLLDGRLHLTGGMRYTHDSKHGRVTSIAGAPAPAALRFEFDSKRVDPAATLAFDITDHVNSYVRWGRAYRAGGANSRSATFRAFDEEVASTWEIGLKSDLLDRRVRLNLAAYVSRLKNPQLDYASPLNPSATETINGDRPVKAKGIEADITIAPGGGLVLNGSYSLTDATVTPQINPFTNLITTTRISQTPRHAATASLDYSFPSWSFGTLKVNVNGDWSSGFYASTIDTTKSNPVIVLNGRLTLGDVDLGGSKVDFSLWGKNLTNAAYQQYDIATTSPGTTFANRAFFNEPRSYGVEARLRF